MRRHSVDMRALSGSLLCLSCLGLATACGDSDHPGTSGKVDTKPAYTRVGSTRGGPIVATRDERVAVATNRTTGVVTVFHLDPTKPPAELITGKRELDFDDPVLDRTSERSSEPWAAVLGTDDDTAYVIARNDARVVRITHLHGEPKIDGWLSTGAEPTSIVISPSGNRLFIANWGEGTIGIVTTPDFAVRPGIDLNEAIAGVSGGPDGSGPPILGNVEPRPGLAHPRALALTDNGDDKDDETLYATEFFSVPGRRGAPGVPVTDPPSAAEFDGNRRGLVYAIPLSEGTTSTISLLPAWDTGFSDSNGDKTGCFPNQLYAAAVDGGRLLVTSMCASPRGPLGVVKQGDPANPVNNTSNFKTLMHPVVSVIDVNSNTEVPEERRVLTQEIEQLNSTSPNSVPRMPLIPTDLVFAGPSGGTQREAFVTAMGADAVFRLGEPGAVQFVDVAPEDQIQGHLPIGTAVLEKAYLALVLNDNSQSVSVVDLSSNAVQWVESTIEKTDHAITTRDSEANAGHLFFATGSDVWSFKGQAWGSCEGCHPDGLSDGVTWFFARGPRRTLSTAGTYDAAGNRRVMLWTGNIDEVHDIEAIVRTVTGGVGGVLWKYSTSNSTNDDRILYDGSAAPTGPGKAKPTSILRNGLSGSVKELLDIRNGALCTSGSTVCDRSASGQWNDIDAFIRSVRTPNRPTNLSPSQVERGANLFREGRCSACHAGQSWTISRVFYQPGEDYNGTLPYTPPPLNPDGSDPVLDIGRLRTETYSVPPELQPLNPVSLPDGLATFRRWDPKTLSPLVYLYGTEAKDGYDASKKTHGNDQINCVLRAVGTFPDQSAAANNKGIVAADAPPVLEVRQDMTTLALGDKGFNVPSLLGLATAGSYFHAGNARTLEEVFDTTFDVHLRALNSSFLSDGATRARDVADLVAFILSIDDAQTVEPVPTDLGFDPDLCAQMKIASQAAPAPQCTSGDRRCAGDAGVQVCNIDGTWGSVTACSDGETCTSCSGTPECAPFPTPARMDDVDLSGFNTSDIHFSDGELGAFFVSNRPGPSGSSPSGVWTATRTDRAAPFGPATPVAIPHSGIVSISLEGDLNTIFFEGSGPQGINGLYKATGDPQSGFDAGTLLFSDAGDPFVSRDTTRLYYSSGGWIAFANRVGTSYVNGGTLVTSGFAPVVTEDELTMYFSSYDAGPEREQISITRRKSLSDPFGTAVPLAGVNSTDMDIADWVSPDGCRMYLHRIAFDRIAAIDVYVSEKK